MDVTDGVVPSVTCRRLSAEGGGGVSAVCVGDLWLGTNDVLKTNDDEKGTSGRHNQRADYFESVVFYAASDFFIYCAARPRDKGRPDVGQASRRVGHELGPGSSASHGETLLSNVRISAADPALVVGMAAVGSRRQRNYSELVALDENGTATVFLGIHILHVFRFSAPPIFQGTTLQLLPIHNGIEGGGCWGEAGYVAAFETKVVLLGPSHIQATIDFSMESVNPCTAGGAPGTGLKDRAGVEILAFLPVTILHRDVVDCRGSKVPVETNRPCVLISTTTRAILSFDAFGARIARGEALHPILCMDTVAHSTENSSFVVCGQADGTVVTVCGYEGSSFLWGHQLGCPFVPRCLVAVHEGLVFCAGRARSGVLLDATKVSAACTKDKAHAKSHGLFRAVGRPIKLPSWISTAALVSSQAPSAEEAGQADAARSRDFDWSIVGLFDDGHLYVLETHRRAPRDRAGSAGSCAVAGVNQSVTAS